MAEKAQKRQAQIDHALKKLFAADVSHTLQGDYQQDLAYLKAVFQDDDPIQFHSVQIGGKAKCPACLIYCDGLVNSKMIDNYLIRPLVEMDVPLKGISAQLLSAGVLQVNSVKTTTDYNEIIQGITYGDTLLLAEGLKEGLLFSTKSFPMRSVAEPEGEKVLSGPREGFTEAILTNLSMVRRRLRTPKLKMRYCKLGARTSTQLCVAYLDGLVKPEVLEELYVRLAKIDMDGVLDANYINELIRDNTWSPFRSIGYTERPDVITAKLLEGRVAVFVDGTPVVLTLPYFFIENFQSNEDYYLSFYYTSFSRLLRMVGFLLTIIVPALYIAVVAYHQEMLPAPLLISIATERQSVPLPAALEAFIMLVIFEILRETGLRMQANVGQALSIVGALVVGQAAVEAKLVAAPMIIIVAMTGITSLLVPKMNAPILLIRFGILLLASCLGFLGVTLGFALLLTHALSLRSFGIWQLAPDQPPTMQSMKDTAIRAPWFQMLLRPRGLAVESTRQKNISGDTP